VDDGLLVDAVDGGQDAAFEFLFGGDAYVAQPGAGEVGEEALDEVQPRAMLWVNVNSKRPSGCVASQALVSLEMWAE
jgi:hypothetical protein